MKGKQALGDTFCSHEFVFTKEAVTVQAKHTIVAKSKKTHFSTPLDVLSQCHNSYVVIMCHKFKWHSKTRQNKKTTQLANSSHGSTRWLPDSGTGKGACCFGAVARASRMPLWETKLSKGGLERCGAAAGLSHCWGQLRTARSLKRTDVQWATDPAVFQEENWKWKFMQRPFPEASLMRHWHRGSDVYSIMVYPCNCPTIGRHENTNKSRKLQWPKEIRHRRR